MAYYLDLIVNLIIFSLHVDCSVYKVKACPTFLFVLPLFSVVMLKLFQASSEKAIYDGTVH